MATDLHSYQDRTAVDPNVLVGKSVVTGTLIPVYPILNLFAHGYDFDQVIDSYPNLTHEDVKAALLFAARVVERPAAPELNCLPSDLQRSIVNVRV